MDTQAAQDRPDTAGTARVTAGADAPTKRSRARFYVLGLLATGTMINFLDRTILGIAAPSLSHDLGLTPTTLGLVFSAFAWTYALAQIPGGVFLDRFGNRLTYCLSITFWSLFTLIQGLATGLNSLFVMRLGLGIAEAPCFPTNSRVVGFWFPQRERARATGIFTVGEYVGLAFFSPLLFFVMGRFGWHVLFYGVGVVGLCFAVLWWRTYRDPDQFPWVNAAERAYIADDGEGNGPVDRTTTSVPFSWRNVRLLLSHRQVWGASLGQFAGNATLIFFLTWFPTYLAKERHMEWMKVGMFAVMPFIAAGVGVIFGGWLSDFLLTRTGSANLARKLPIVTGLLMAASIVSANYVDSDSLVIVILSIAFFGQGMVGLGWVVITDIAPQRLMGLTGGIYSFMTNLSGITTPIVIGVIVSTTGSFVWALFFMAILALLGALSYIFLLGDVKRIHIDLPSA